MIRQFTIPSIVAFLCALHLAAALDDFPYGAYELRRNLFENTPASCPESVEIKESGSTIEDSDVRMDDAVCEGADWKFKSFAIGFKALFISNARSGDVTCGPLNIGSKDYVVVFQISDPTLIPVEKLGELLGDPTFNITELKLSEFKTDVFYITYYASATDICNYEWTGALKDDAFSTPPPSEGEGSSSPPASPAGNSSNECFPASADVRLRDGRLKRMDEVRIGDVVQTGKGTFSPVFTWTHRDPDAMSTFVEIGYSSSARPLHVTPYHFVYKAGDGGDGDGDGDLVLARQLAVGDSIIRGDGTCVTVAWLRFVRMDGLYNPQTLDGDIVVNGVRVSTYTLAVQPGAAHALLSPLRAAFKTVMMVRPLWAGSEL